MWMKKSGCWSLLYAPLHHYVRELLQANQEAGGGCWVKVHLYDVPPSEADELEYLFSLLFKPARSAV